MSEILQVVPILPSQDIARDVEWYTENLGFEAVHNDKMYAVLKRSRMHIHLQWHANTPEDPLLGGSVIKIFVDDFEAFVSEFIGNHVISHEKVRYDTAWGTNEFGLYDLNKNAIFFVEDI